jgi:hypothetical protein
MDLDSICTLYTMTGRMRMREERKNPKRLKAIASNPKFPNPLRGKRILREMPGATPGFGCRASWPLPSFLWRRARHGISVKGSAAGESIE